MIEQLKNSLVDLYNRYIDLPSKSQEKIEEFHSELTDTANELLRLTAIGAAIVLLSGRIGDFIYMEEPYLWTVMEWRIWITVLGGIGTILLYFEFYWPDFETIFTSFFLPVVLLTGYYLSFVGREYPIWMGIIFLCPFLAIVLPCGIIKRSIITFLSSGALLTMILERGFELSLIMPSIGIFLGTIVVSIIIGHCYFYRLNYLNYFAEQDLHREKQRSEDLLANILPEKIAQRLPENKELIADGYDEATVLFADIVEFTPLADDLPPDMVVMLLDDIFSSFDNKIREFPVEKIKTVGDEYFIVSGVPESVDNHAVIASKVALRFHEEIQKYKRKEGHSFRLRIGLNTGPVVAGVIGTDKFVYDVWGDTVNVGSRMESQGIPGKIQVTQATKEAIEKQDSGGQFEFEERGTIEVKGKGEMTTYFLQKA